MKRFSIELSVLFLLFYGVECVLGFENWSSLRDCVEKYPEIHVNEGGSGSGGRPAMKHEFPHAVAIGWTDPITGEIKWTCGGSLITDNTVLTAAHCTINRDGQKPDVARLGDLNLETDDDDKETQQRKIKTIIPHPEYASKASYHDIALLKLENSVSITHYVIPACLWPYHDLHKDSILEACGFGQTESLGPISPILNKFVVSPVNQTSCSEEYSAANYRKLQRGFTDSLFCAKDRTEKRMDTCEGDSGGPLEMKLRSYIKIIPYIVGITAFGKGCGSSTPGVYTRVSSYINWIKSHVDIKSEPLECAEINQDMRYADYSSVGYSQNKPQKPILGVNPSERCYGMVLTSKFLLSSANCLSKMNNPNLVMMNSYYDPLRTEEIDHIFVHPKYSAKSPYKNDIALIKLKTEIEFTAKDYPTCLTDREFTEPYQNPTQREEYTFLGNFTEFKGTSQKNLAECLDFYGSKIKESDLDTNTLCYNSGLWNVPKSCKVPLGSGVSIYTISFEYTTMTVTKGLALFSEDCGPVFATNVSNYIDWMDSIIFRKNEDSSIVFSE